MINALPIIGWIVSFIVSISLAVPFWFLWTFCGLGRVYCYFLPEVYLSPSFGDVIGIFMIVSILKAVFVPKIATNSNSNTSK